MIDLEKEELASKLKGSLLEFIRFFFKYTTGRDLIISSPPGRESHHITLCRYLTKAFRLEIPEHRLIINVPPGYSKSLFVSMWVAWSLAQYHDSNYLYISYSHELASKHTSFIKGIVSSRLYKYLFGAELRYDSRAKDHFATTKGGTVYAFGSGGAITGQDAGLPGLDRFSGAVIIDDPIKPDAVHSDAIRGSITKNYQETIRQRVRGINVPIIFIGQRLHEDDLAAFLLSGKDVTQWETLILKALDDAGNPLYPEINPKSQLLALQEKSPYVFASQYQQDPTPAGGALFKESWFELLPDEPSMIETFITADTAETSKSWNDATAFSFWGLYEIVTFGRKTGTYGLHWIDCVEMRIEPKDLKEAFLDFWQDCMRYKTPPKKAFIEKKSTGVTLSSVLQDIRGLQVRNIERNRSSGSKTERFLQIQPYIAEKRISLPAFGKHTKLVIDHMQRITANETHRFDDICDTAADAIRIAIIDKTLNVRDTKQDANIASIITAHDERIRNLKDW